MFYIITPELVFLFIPFIIVLLLTFKKDIYDLNKELFKTQLWNCYDLLLLFIILLFYRFLALSVFKSPHYIKFFYTLGFSITSGIVVFSILKFKYGLRISSLGIIKKSIRNNIISGLKIFFLYEAVKLGVFLISNTESLLFNYSKTDLVEYSGIEFFVYIIFIILIVPFVEEGVFRGFTFVPLARKIGKTAGFFLTSFLWASFHGYDKFASLIILGLILVYLYEKTSSLIPSITLHALVNSFAVGFYYYSIVFKKYIYFIEPKKFLEIITLIFLLCFIALTVSFKTKKEKL
jgi:membrane protease YdiL (CAAX protease family)